MERVSPAHHGGPTRRPARRSLARLAAVTGVTAVLVGLLASPAFAHAVLLETIPGEGAVLTTPPRTVTLRYNEQVTVTAGSVRVFDSHSRRVDTGSLSKPSADVVQVSLPSHLADGAYVVTWRVVSADTHPVEGAFTFQVGLTANATAPSFTGLAQNLLHNQKGDQAVGVIYGVLRGVLFTGLALLIGAVAFGAFVWAGARPLRRTAQLLWAGWWLSALATVGQVLIQGAYGAALPLGDVFRTDLIRSVLGSQFGHMSVARLVVLAAMVPLLRALQRVPAERPLPTWGTAAIPVVGVVLALTVSLASHAHTGDYTWLAVPADVIHILAMGVWLGGLVVLAWAVFPGRRVADLGVAVPRFSRAAMASVIALVVTGLFQSWRQVGSIHALRTTTYGQTLMVKVFIVVVLVVVAALSRQIVGYLFPPREPAGTEPRVPVVAGGADDDPPAPDHEESDTDEASELRRLRRSVVAEVLLGLAVVVVTALLVNAAPAKIAAAQRGGGVSGVTLKSSQVWVDLSVVPGRAPGANDVHVTAILPSGAPINLMELRATIDYPSRNIAPLEIPMRRLSPGHYLSPGFTIPFSGSWRITAHALLSQFNEVTLAGTIPVA
jgi:copper transport protein